MSYFQNSHIYRSKNDFSCFTFFFFSKNVFISLFFKVMIRLVMTRCALPCNKMHIACSAFLMFLSHALQPKSIPDHTLNMHLPI